MLDYFFEYSLCLGLFYGFYVLCLRNDSFLQRNRYYLLLSSVLALLIPLIEFPVPGESSGQAVPLNLEVLTLQVNTLKSNLLPNADYSVYFFWGYVVGVCISGFYFLLRFWQLLHIIQSHEVIHQAGYLQINTGGKLPTFSFFNYLFWDDSQSLSKEENEKIRYHELKHIHDRHSYDILYFEFLRIFFWFNPFVYIFQKALRDNHEYIADASVMRHSDLPSYQRLMVRRLFEHLKLNMAHSFNQTEIKSRLHRLQKRPTPSYWKLKMFFILPLLASLLLAFSGKTHWQDPDKNLQIEQNRFADVEGGLDRFYAELAGKLRYPKEARQKKIQGRVFVRFMVMPDGSLTDFKVLKGIHPACDQAAMDAIKSTNTIWLPARVNGKAVRQELTIPIQFSLN